MSICMVAVGRHRIDRYLRRLGRLLLRIWLNLSEIRFLTSYSTMEGT